MAININDIFNIINPSDYIIALNNPIKNEDPLSYYLYSENDLMRFIGWYKGNNDRSAFRVLDTKYNLQFVQFYQQDLWLFIGCFSVAERKLINEHGEYYELIREKIYDKYAGRLVVRYKKTPGPKQAKLSFQSKHSSFEVVKILEQVFSGDIFPGYKNITLGFKELKSIIYKNLSDWKNHLSTIKGVYLITDLKTQKFYIGSAYGDLGIWNRWSTYAYTNGHGNNKLLKKLVGSNDDYAENNFSFTLLEYYKEDISNDDIIKRESYWKKVLGSRSYGLNLN